jgi:hypothetical protein
MRGGSRCSSSRLEKVWLALESFSSAAARKSWRVAMSRHLGFYDPHDADNIIGAVIGAVTSAEIDVTSIYGRPANDQHVVIRER